MPAKPSGEVKTRVIRNTQKNGDIYVLERQIAYDPDKKQNRVLSTKLLSKIPKGTEISVPTRPKNTKTGTNAELAPTNGISNSQNLNRLTASRIRVGMMNIIDHIGRASGIDDAIYANTDTGTAEKIISLVKIMTIPFRNQSNRLSWKKSCCRGWKTRRYISSSSGSTLSKE